MPRFLPGLPHRLLLAIAGLVACCAAAAARAPTPRALVNEMGNVDMFGIEAATLALQKTDSAAIKAFAHQLADEHATAASSLRRIVSRRSDIALPDRPDERHLDVLGDLSKRDGSELFSMPKAAVLRSYAFNHLVHHRGQLSVYLRLRDVPVPPIYGPSADERP